MASMSEVVVGLLPCMALASIFEQRAWKAKEGADIKTAEIQSRKSDVGDFAVEAQGYQNERQWQLVVLV